MRPYTLPILSASELKAQALSTPEHPHSRQARNRGNKGLPQHFRLRKGRMGKALPPSHHEITSSTNCDLVHAEHDEEGEFYRFPDQTHLPLVVAARMSLSFPGLICAVPLWRRDYTLEKSLRNQLQRCLFSDGGLSSNFPIHFFDHLLPNHPTFAITLDEYDERRGTTRARTTKSTTPASMRAMTGANRAGLVADDRSGSLIPVVPFQGLLAFLMRLIDSAKNWQDSLQSALPGYSRTDRPCLPEARRRRDLTSRWTPRPSRGWPITERRPATSCAKNSSSIPTVGPVFSSPWRGWRKPSTRWRTPISRRRATWKISLDFLAHYPQGTKHYEQRPGRPRGDARPR